MPTKLTCKEVELYISSFGCKLLSKEYRGLSYKLDILCVCGDVYSVRFGDFKKGQVKCKHCTGKKRRYSEIKEEIEKQGCKLLTSKEEYKNTSQKLLVECGCGKAYTTEINIFRKGQVKCNQCVKKEKPHRKFTYEQVKEYIERISDCKLLSTEYNTCREKLDIKCGCGKNFKRALCYVKRDNYLKCIDCTRKDQAEKFRFGQKDIEDRLFKIYGDKYEYIPYHPYKNVDSTIRIKHKDCGQCFDITLKELIIAERRCKVCEKKDSVGILKIMKWLDENAISYEREYVFEDCVYKRKLPFDIYIEHMNLLIEYDGEQHFKPVYYFGGEKGFKLQQKRDQIKNKYCIDNNISLLRIRFDEVKNIETILETYFNKIS